MAYRFDPQEGVREAMARCAREQLDRAVSELSEAVGEPPAAAIHAARKAVKKERALLRLARGTMPSRQRRRENAALALASRGLSEARDAEVMIQTLNRLSERFVGQLPESTFRTVHAHLEAARAGQRGELAGAPLGARAAAELEAVRLRAEAWKLTDGGWTAIEPGLLRSYRRGRQAFIRARRRGSLEDLHAWRKRVKDLWYQERLLAAVCGPAVRGQAKEAHRLADRLGDDHDLGLLRRRLTHGHVDVAVDLDAVVELIDHRRAELQTEAIQVGKRVYAEKPKAFGRRMKRYWRAGRAAAEAPRRRRPAELAQATRVVHHA